MINGEAGAGTAAGRAGRGVLRAIMGFRQGVAGHGPGMAHALVAAARGLSLTSWSCPFADGMTVPVTVPAWWAPCRAGAGASAVVARPCPVRAAWQWQRRAGHDRVAA
ncbi:hypothetical protein [Komagataeibacter rhaeticus]|uniref:hypothetical protein n=1 Tax=Komagataeibacter rhaeticus TaxID=215221 RepID=UPI000587F4EE|nr:hypothetical protein [Komagataeibacter rhaeticus]ATU72924.1 hypothetical protein CT154_08790 [Komagataeibacter xylinus]QOC47893.1 hypothetical protein ICJ78_07555 [Komagataeibacter rhaeticus]